MRIFFKQSVDHFQNSNGHKKTSFEIIKGKNGEIQQIKGIGNKDEYHIKQVIHKKNKDSGKIISKKRVFKIKSSNLMSLLKESAKIQHEEKKKMENIETNLSEYSYETKPKKKVLTKKVKTQVVKPKSKPVVKKEVKPVVKKEVKPVVKKEVKPVVKKESNLVVNK
jgi:hypothetical protein